ncbi:MAG: sugar phosphate isomerase/epimerase family protein [Verrucomicrobiota bacterium]
MIDRRDFLSRTASASALLTGAGTLGTALTPNPASASVMKDRIRKGVKYSMVKEPELSVVDQFKMVKEVGFDGLELRTDDKDDLQTYLKAVDQSDLVVHGIVNSNKPDLETAVKFCHDVGGDSVLYVANYDKKRPLMESWNETKAVIKKGLPAAEEHQVKILVENVWAGFLISALDMERYVDEINHPWFGAYFDVGNNVRWGIPEHWIGLLGDRIGKLDIKEWDARKHQQEGLRSGFGSQLGEGTINWPAVCEALREIDFRGWATAEVGGGNRERLADISARMDRILELA